MVSKYKAYTGKILDIKRTTGSIGEYKVDDTDREVNPKKRQIKKPGLGFAIRE